MLKSNPSHIIGTAEGLAQKASYYGLSVLDPQHVDDRIKLYYLPLAKKRDHGQRLSVTERYEPSINNR